MPELTVFHGKIPASIARSATDTQGPPAGMSRAMHVMRKNRKAREERELRSEFADRVRHEIVSRVADEMSADLKRMDDKVPEGLPANWKQVADEARDDFVATGLDEEKLQTFLRAHPEHLANVRDLAVKASDPDQIELDADGLPEGLHPEIKAAMLECGLNIAAARDRRVQRQLDKRLEVDADGYPKDMPPEVKEVFQEAGLDGRKLPELVKAMGASAAFEFPKGERAVKELGEDGFPINMAPDAKAALVAAGLDPKKLVEGIRQRAQDPAWFQARLREKMVREMLHHGLGPKEPPYEKRLGFEEFLRQAKAARERFNQTGETGGFPPELKEGVAEQMKAMGAMGLSTAAVAIPEDLAEEFLQALDDCGQPEARTTGHVDLGPILATSLHKADCTCPPCRLKRIVALAVERNPDAQIGNFVDPEPPTTH